MRRDNSSPLKPLSLYKLCPFFVKLVFLSLLVIFATRLFSSRTFDPASSSSVLKSQTQKTSSTDSEKTDHLLLPGLGSLAPSSSESFEDETPSITTTPDDPTTDETIKHETKPIIETATIDPTVDIKDETTTNTTTQYDPTVDEAVKDEVNSTTTTTESNSTVDEVVKDETVSVPPLTTEWNPTVDEAVNPTNSTPTTTTTESNPTAEEAVKDEVNSTTTTTESNPTVDEAVKDETNSAPTTTESNPTVDEAVKDETNSAPTTTESNPTVDEAVKDETQPQTTTTTTDSNPPVDEAVKDDTTSTNTAPTQDDPAVVEASKEETKPPKCDLFKGEWVPNPAGPSYTNWSCPLIEGHQNCMRNGRPDSEYLNWKWKPWGCDLPPFNAQKFLDLMRNKRWGFIGDSISRNHVQSLLCILSQVEQAQEIYHDEQWKSRTWIFPSYNVTVAVVWAPFLLKADIYEDNNGFSTKEIQLHLDRVDDTWNNRYKDFDYVIIAAGKWYLKTAIYHENNTVQGCHYCPGKNLTELGFDYAYRKALNQVFDFIVNSDHKPFVLFRPVTPDHFEFGEWHNGGMCNRTLPFKEGERNISDVDRMLREIEMQEYEKAIGVASERGAVLKLLDTTNLSQQRPDGHPGVYRQYQPFATDKNAKVQTDCLHWCLPGPIDYWNDVIMEMVVNG